MPTACIRILPQIEILRNPLSHLNNLVASFARYFYITKFQSKYESPCMLNYMKIVGAVSNIQRQDSNTRISLLEVF